MSRSKKELLVFTYLNPVFTEFYSRKATEAKFNKIFGYVTFSLIINKKLFWGIFDDEKNL